MKDREALRRSTIIWGMAAAWLLLSYVVQDPPRDEYDRWFRGVFTVVMAVFVPLVSLLVALAWWNALRRR